MNEPTLNPTTFVPVYLREAKAKQKVDELSWVDVKRDWKDLSTDAALAEFLKDVAALANGPQDGLLLFGVDGNPYALHDAPFAKSGYTDSAQIQQRINAKISPPVGIDVGDLPYEGKVVSFVHVRPTHNRPHLVVAWEPQKGKVYRNALFWKRGTTTCGPQSQVAEFPERTELEAMFADRPGSYSRLLVRPLPGKKPRFGGQSNTSVLHIPISIFNMGSIGTSVCEIHAEAELSRGGSAAMPTIIFTKAIQSSLQQNARVETPCPIDLVPGASVSGDALIEFTSIRPALNPYFIAGGTHRLNARIVVVDPNGAEWAGQFNLAIEAK